MSGAIMNKIWGAFGMDANEEEEEDYVENNEEMEEEEENNKENKLWGRRNNKVVAMPQPQQVKMVISQPTTFDQAEDICDLLKEKQSVIVNLEYVNKDVARRIIDVVSGAVHALDGHIQKVSNSIFFPSLITKRLILLSLKQSYLLLKIKLTLIFPVYLLQCKSIGS